jgi:hypothetical protein
VGNVTKWAASIEEYLGKLLGWIKRQLLYTWSLRALKKIFWWTQFGGHFELVIRSRSYMEHMQAVPVG